MASPSDHEDGEIVEEGGDETRPMQANVSAGTSSCAAVSEVSVSLTFVQPTNESILPIASSNPRKRLHSTLQDVQAADSSSKYDKRTPLSHHRPVSTSHHPSREYNDRTRDEQPDDRIYNADLIVKHPRQEPRSKVLLDFATWMAGARCRKRLDVEDVQKLVLNVLKGGSRQEKGRISPYLLPFLNPGADLPTRVCMVLVGKLHPSIVQKYRAKFSFFDACSSVPVTLTKPAIGPMRKSETPLPELMYRFSRPHVDTHDLSTDELFYAHELTFLMKHSAGYTDEMVFLPTGTFTRKSQPLGGTWKLDGDLLHLKWKHRTAKGATGAGEIPIDQDLTNEEGDADTYTLDVLVSQDASMHEFRTDAVTDETYARKQVLEPCAKKRRHDDKPRSMWLSLAQAIAVEVPRSADGRVLRSKEMPKKNELLCKPEDDESSSINAENKDERLTRDAFAYYLLSIEEMKLHGYPTNIEEEQRELLLATDGNTRDRYVATKPRPQIQVDDPVVDDDEEGAAMETDETIAAAATESNFIYALDCEMCETDLGMELTRVTVVDLKGAVVYDQLVKPQSTIINYHTEFSGISKDTLQDTTYIVADVQRDLTTRFLFHDTILVGHSLTSDLRALRLIHPTIVDTAILFPHERGFPYRTSLKTLTKTYLKKEIQMQLETGHDSAEDAIAALELVLLKVRQGPWFGIPDVVSQPSSAFDSIAEKLAVLEKKMTLMHLETTDTAMSDRDASEVKNRKPWELYASGDLKDQSQHPLRHAKAVKKDLSMEIQECWSWGQLQTQLQHIWRDDLAPPDLCWVEIEPPSASAAECHDFVRHHERWMTAQHAYCEQVDAFLQYVHDDVIGGGTLLLALPQGDLSLVRYLKGLRTRAKWRDATSPSDALGSEELHAAVGDALGGALDSCLFLRQK